MEELRSGILLQWAKKKKYNLKHTPSLDEILGLPVRERKELQEYLGKHNKDPGSLFHFYYNNMTYGLDEYLNPDVPHCNKPFIVVINEFGVNTGRYPVLDDVFGILNENFPWSKSLSPSRRTTNALRANQQTNFGFACGKNLGRGEDPEDKGVSMPREDAETKHYIDTLVQMSAVAKLLGMEVPMTMSKLQPGSGAAHRYERFAKRLHEKNFFEQGSDTFNAINPETMVMQKVKNHDDRQNCTQFTEVLTLASPLYNSDTGELIGRNAYVGYMRQSCKLASERFGYTGPIVQQCQEYLAALPTPLTLANFEDYMRASGTEGVYAVFEKESGQLVSTCLVTKASTCKTSTFIVSIPDAMEKLDQAVGGLDHRQKLEILMTVFYSSGYFGIATALYEMAAEKKIPDMGPNENLTTIILLRVEELFGGPTRGPVQRTGPWANKNLEKGQLASDLRLVYRLVEKTMNDYARKRNNEHNKALFCRWAKVHQNDFFSATLKEFTKIRFAGPLSGQHFLQAALKCGVLQIEGMDKCAEMTDSNAVLHSPESPLKKKNDHPTIIKSVAFALGISHAEAEDILCKAFGDGKTMDMQMPGQSFFVHEESGGGGNNLPILARYSWGDKKGTIKKDTDYVPKVAPPSRDYKESLFWNPEKSRDLEGCIPFSADTLQERARGKCAKYECRKFIPSKDSTQSERDDFAEVIAIFHSNKEWKREALPALQKPLTKLCYKGGVATPTVHHKNAPTLQQANTIQTRCTSRKRKEVVSYTDTSWLATKKRAIVTPEEKLIGVPVVPTTSVEPTKDVYRVEPVPPSCPEQTSNSLRSRIQRRTPRNSVPHHQVEPQTRARRVTFLLPPLPPMVEQEVANEEAVGGAEDIQESQRQLRSRAALPLQTERPIDPRYLQLVSSPRFDSMSPLNVDDVGTLSKLVTASKSGGGPTVYDINLFHLANNILDDILSTNRYRVLMGKQYPGTPLTLGRAELKIEQMVIPRTTRVATDGFDTSRGAKEMWLASLPQIGIDFNKSGSTVCQSLCAHLGGQEVLDENHQKVMVFPNIKLARCYLLTCIFVICGRHGHRSKKQKFLESVFGGRASKKEGKTEALQVTSNLFGDDLPVFCMIRQGRCYWIGILQPKGKGKGRDIFYVRYL